MQVSLRAGMEAARRGEKDEAFRILSAVLAQDERNELAWLWLSSVVDTDEERREALNKALEIHPNSIPALRGLAKLDRAAVSPPTSQAFSIKPAVWMEWQAEPSAHSEQPAETSPDSQPGIIEEVLSAQPVPAEVSGQGPGEPASGPEPMKNSATPRPEENGLEQAIACAQRGEKVEALRMLLAVVQADERNEQAWLWLSRVVDSDDDRRVALENILALNPGSVEARQGLQNLEASAEPAKMAASEDRSAAADGPATLPFDPHLLEATDWLEQDQQTQPESTTATARAEALPSAEDDVTQTLRDKASQGQPRSAWLLAAMTIVVILALIAGASALLLGLIR